MMDKQKKELLEAAGWKIGTVAEFLELTPEDAEVVEMKLRRSNEEIDAKNSNPLNTMG